MGELLTRTTVVRHIYGKPPLQRRHKSLRDVDETGLILNGNLSAGRSRLKAARESCVRGLTSLNGIGKAAACDLGSHLISYRHVSVEFLGLPADVDLHLSEVRRVAKDFVPP